MRSRTRSRAATCATAVALAVMLVLASPGAAMATIYLMDQKWVSSSTNPGEYGDHAVVWREGWGNHPLAQFLIKIPQPNEGEPAILGSYYTVMRPNAAMPTTITPDMWPNCYNAPVNAASEWKLPIDLIAEDANPGPYFGPTTMVPGAARTYEGPYAVRFRFYAKDEPKAAGEAFGFGLDVTPPAQVTGLRGLPGYGDAPVNGWLRQSRIHLFWTDKVYDRLAGTGYFEAFLDGKPYYKPGDADDKTKTTYRVYDLKEHFPGFGMTIGTRRQMTIEDLPAGKHTLQIRAVDRATNAGASVSSDQRIGGSGYPDALDHLAQGERPDHRREADDQGLRKGPGRRQGRSFLRGRRLEGY